MGLEELVIVMMVMKSPLCPTSTEKVTDSLVQEQTRRRIKQMFECRTAPSRWGPVTLTRFFFLLFLLRRVESFGIAKIFLTRVVTLGEDTGRFINYYHVRIDKYMWNYIYNFFPGRETKVQGHPGPKTWSFQQ